MHLLGTVWPPSSCCELSCAWEKRRELTLCRWGTGTPSGLQMSEGIELNPCHVGSAVRMFFSSQDIHFRILTAFPPGGA